MRVPSLDSYQTCSVWICSVGMGTVMRAHSLCFPVEAE